MSRLTTSSAFSLMNLRRSSTFSPISVEKISSAATASSRRTFSSVRDFRVHGGVPKLLGIHFAQALETGDGEFFLGVLEHVIQHAAWHLPSRLFRPCARSVNGRRSRSAMAECRVRRRLYSAVQASAQLMRRSPPFFSTSSCRLCSSSNINLCFQLQLRLFDGLGQFLQFFLVAEIGLSYRVRFPPASSTSFGSRRRRAKLRRHLIVFLNIQQECASGRRLRSPCRPCPSPTCSSVARFISFAREFALRRGCSGPSFRASPDTSGGCAI